jgi:LysM repeat protein
LQLFAPTPFSVTLRAMRVRALVVVAAAVGLVAPSAAWGEVAHTVAPGESLWSIAQTDGLSVAQLAAANGLSGTSRLAAGSTVMIPPRERAAGNRNGGFITGASGANRNAATGGGTNVTALVEVNIGSIQANVGSRSQYNTAEGSAGEAIAANGANARGGEGGTRGPVIDAKGAASGSSEAPHGATGRAEGDSAGDSTAGPVGAGLGMGALWWLWSGLGALAGLPHSVAPGESLWSIAQNTGLSAAQLAAANRLTSTTPLVAGSTLMIPPPERAGGGPNGRF